MPTALFFGFTHCKDVCPQTLSLLGTARSKAGLNAGNLAIVMVTVDPARDTPAVLKQFVATRHVQAEALTGSSLQMHGVYRSYGVVIYPQKSDLSHTDYIYLIDAKARLREALSPQEAPGTVALHLRKLVDAPVQ